jgi:hypothetical protein
MAGQGKKNFHLVGRCIVNVRQTAPLVLVLLLSLVVLPAATGAQEAPPQSAASPDSMPALIYPLFSYQGHLAESGVPVTGTRSMTFRLWTAPSGGGMVWEEGPEKVAVANGLFTATLGDTTALPVNWFAYDLWIEVQVGATTLPRQKLMGAPYAMSLAPGAQVFGSKSSSDPAIVTVENAGTGAALKARAGDGRAVNAESGSGSALYATSSGNSEATLQVANTSTMGPAARVESNGSLYAAAVTNSYAGGSSSGGVLHLTTNGGRVILAQNKSFTQLFTLEANGDVTQSRTAGGLVKVAIAAYCGDTGSTITRYFTNGIIPTIANGASEGTCTINPGFNPSDRYWTVTPTDSSQMRLAYCNLSAGQFNCMRTNITGGGVDGPIQMLIY